MKEATLNWISLFLCLFISFQLFASNKQRTENDSIVLNKKRLHYVLGSEAFIYTSSMAGLYSLWYKDYPHSKFHFINDNNEWLQMDKMGHATTAYYVGKVGYDLMNWCGVSEKKSIYYGGSIGFIYLTTIEILDGISKEWGASAGDLLANTSGSALFIGQQLAWNEQKILLKWSYNKNDIVKYRPDLYGETLAQNMLKDYNGQTYWISGNIKSLLNLQNEKFPTWLNVSIGYGADGMTGGTENLLQNDGVAIPEHKRIRQYYFSLDADLTRIHTKSNVLNLLLKSFGFIKIPFPTLEYNPEDGLVFHPVYF